ncbi:MAG TPA: N-acetylmuramoyl-L-alanine amidase [Thermoanaerobaculia bacterium]|nr:N-acetylmuramoyl-L-alanine amidase [Thermoanaerobaculia bacterium]
MKTKSYPLKNGQWFPELTEKKYVVWHGTAGRTRHTPVSGRPGHATTSIDAWNLNADRVGAPYLVDRDGTIYKTFDDVGWIYHLGLKGTKARYDKASVAIEFANEGGLSLDGDRLHAFGMNTPNTVYTGPVLSHEWRGFNFFAQLDEAQVDAGIELTLDICRRHDIDPVFYYPSTTYDFPRCFQVATIICHSNCRADKTDMCLPEWVFEKVEAAGIKVVR